MEQRYLGRTGLLVSELCLGTMTFGADSTEQESIRMMDAFVDAGGTFLDTADIYTNGESENIIGKWLSKKPRDEFVIATKVRFMLDQKSNNVGLSRKHILVGVENSLRRLKTDYIDLYQVHCWDAGTPLEETLATLDTLVRSGKVRYVGVSNYNAWQIQRAVDMSREHGWEIFCSLQPLYNMLDRYIEWEIVELCIREGLGIIPWSPLRGGWLSGKYRRGMEAPIEGARVERAGKEGLEERWENYATERTWQIIDALYEVAAQVDKSPAQVALNWLKDRPGVTAPIIGARTLDQLKDNIAASGWGLPCDLKHALDAVSAIGLPYPYSFIRMGNSSPPQTLRTSSGCGCS